MKAFPQMRAQRGQELHMSALFTEVQVGRYTLSNRIVMAPMTRSRANDAGIPDDMVATYYEQRASAGLIISEGVFPSALGKGYVRTPGSQPMRRSPRGSA